MSSSLPTKWNSWLLLLHEIHACGSVSISLQREWQICFVSFGYVVRSIAKTRSGPLQLFQIVIPNQEYVVESREAYFAASWMDWDPNDNGH